MSYATKDDLCNAALNFLGEPDATPFTGGTSVRDKACQRHYQQALESVLTLHRWDFATAVAALTLESSQPSQKPADFPSAYTIPTDCLRFQEVILTNGQQLTHFRIIGTNLFLDNIEYTGKIIYTVNDIAVTAMPGIFADCLMMELCKRIAPMICQSPQLMEQMNAQYAQTFGRAIAAETRMTQSAENTSPISLARRTELFQSRFHR